jgi:hypothetical protein
MSLIAPPVAGEETFQVPEGCGSRAEFERELERLLGAETLDPSAYELAISPADEGGYLLRMSVRGERRELRDADCRTLFKSAVVVIAASVKPDLLPARSEEPEPAAPFSSEQQNATVTPSDTVVESAPLQAQASWRGGVGIGGGAIGGWFPESHRSWRSGDSSSEGASGGCSPCATSHWAPRKSRVNVE